MKVSKIALVLVFWFIAAGSLLPAIRAEVTIPEYQARIEECKEALEKNPEQAKVLAEVGWLCHFYLADNQTATEYFRKALSYDSKQAKALEGLGIIYDSKGFYDEAFNHFIQLIYSIPQSPIAEVYLWRAFYLLPSVSAWQELTKLCQDLIDSTLASHILKANAHWILSEVNQRQAKIEEAVAEIEKLGFIKDWLIIGSFDNEGKTGFDQVFAPEEEIDLNKTYEGKERDVKWRRLQIRPKFGYLDLRALFRPHEKTTAYALTFVHSPSHQAIALRVGSSDAIKVWLNDQLLLSRDVYRPANFDQDAAGGFLHQGWNKLLVKVCQDEGDWGLYLRLTDPQGELLPNLSFSTEEVRLKDIKSYPSLEAEAEVKVEKGAIAYFENQVREKPEDAFAYAYLGYLYSVKEAFDIEDEADKKEFLKAMELNSHYAPFHYRLALVESDKNKKRMSLEKALAIDPEHAKSYFRLGRYYYGRDNYQEAEDQFKEALKINPHYLNSRLYLAFIYSYRGWNKEAASELEKIIKLAPHYAPAHSELADCLEKWGTLPQALAEYKTALSLDFTREYTREKLIDIYAYLGDEQKMKEEYKNLLELNPYNINPYLEMAKIYEGLDDYEMAIAQCEKALAICPEDYEVLGEIGRYYHSLGMEEKAHQFWDIALAIKPNYKWLLDYLDFLKPTELAYDEKYRDDVAAILASAPGKSDFPESSVIWLLDKEIQRVYENGTSSYTVHKIVKILDEGAIEDYKHMYFHYTPDLEKVKIKSAKVIRKDGSEVEAETIVDVSGSDVISRLYYEDKYKVVVFSGLEEGAIINFEYKVDMVGANLYADYFGNIFFFQNYEPTLLTKYILIVPKTRPLYFHKHNLEIEPQTITSDEENTITYIWEKKDIDKIEIESRMPPLAELGAYLEVSTFKSWDEMATWFWGLVKDQFKRDKEIEEKVAELVAGKDRPEEKIRAIYNYVVSEIRYVGLEFGIYGYKPHKAKKTFTTKYGDCKDTATLMLAMLEEAGIEAKIALVRVRDYGRVNMDLPSLHIFNHAIVYVPLEKEKGIWLDGTAQFYALEELPSGDQGTVAYHIRDGQGEFKEIPIFSAQDNLQKYVNEIELREDGAAKVKREVFLKGQRSAGVRLDYLVAAKRKEKLEEFWNTRYAGTRVGEYQFSNLEDLDIPVEFEYWLYIPQLAKKTDDFLSFKPLLIEMNLTEDYAPHAVRKHVLKIGYPWRREWEVEYRIPDGFMVDRVPQDHQTTADFGSFSIEYEVEEKIIKCQIKLELSVTEVATSDYAQFREFCQSVDEKTEKEILLKRRFE